MFFSQRFCAPKTGDGIEWEELPSLSSRVRQLGRAPAAPSGWDGTRPAPLTPTAASAPFHEPLSGVAVREVMDPDVLRHFFAV
ncbi:MAG: hypothetical protein M3Z16_04045 [Pseudomonadota bacterium]|nr:hypothetical protein [Pseudomonadota bacterium]